MHLFKVPEYKKNKCYISVRQSKEKIILNEIIIKEVKKLDNSKGYILTCIIKEKNNKESINTVKHIDEQAYEAIKKNNQIWFNNKVDDEELNKLYINSFEIDTGIINLILSINNPINIIINDEIIDDFDVLSTILNDYRNIKKYIINVEINHLGLYFYPKISSNKWLIKTININDYEDNYDNTWSRQEIENDWENDIQELSNNINIEIKRLENLNTKINEIFKEIKDMKNTDNIWENKLNELKSIIISPNNRILSIYDNR
jgi:hypothetical protein